MERCRKIYERQIQVFSFISDVWTNYALFESRLGELQRSRYIFEIAIAQQELDMPENVWKAFIDFEISQVGQEDGQLDYSKARALYKRLLLITKHINVWISHARFEEENVGDFSLARQVYEDAQAHFRDNEPEQKEERAQILEAWHQFECKKFVNEQGLDSERAQKVFTKLPKKVKRRRKVESAHQNEVEEDGEDDEAPEGWEEYIDLIFPEDQAESRNMKILEMAHKWKQDEE